MDLCLIRRRGLGRNENGGGNCRPVAPACRGGPRLAAVRWRGRVRFVESASPKATSGDVLARTLPGVGPGGRVPRAGAQIASTGVRARPYNGPMHDNRTDRMLFEAQEKANLKAAAPLASRMRPQDTRGVRRASGISSGRGSC